MILSEINHIIIPVFGLIGIGYGSGKLRLFTADIGDAIGEFVFALPVPLLIFRTIATSHFPDVSPWPVWIAYFSGVILSWSAGSIFATRLFNTSRAEAVIAGMSASYSNTVMIGIPLVYTAFGEAGTIPLFLILSIHLPLMTIAGSLLTEAAVRGDGRVEEVFSLRRLTTRLATDLLTNPIVIAVLAGGIWRMTGIGIGGPLAIIVDQMAAVAVPCALFSLGMGLQRYGLIGQFRLAMMTTLLKLVLMPLVVFGVCIAFTNLPPLWTAVTTICAGLPAGVNSYLFAVRLNTGQVGAATGVALTSALGIFTLILWLNMLGAG